MNCVLKNACLPSAFFKFHHLTKNLSLVSDAKYSTTINLFLPKQTNCKDYLLQDFGCVLKVMDARATQML